MTILDAIPFTYYDTYLHGPYDVQVAYRVLAVRLALWKYYVNHGKWPSELSKLSPKYIQVLPRDPCDGGPLEWGRKKGHFFLDSITAIQEREQIDLPILS